MNKEQMKDRTKQFALRMIRLCAALPKTEAGRVVARQLLRSGTSVGSNYRAACRARSKREFIAKLGIVEEEADEAACWLELIPDAELMKKSRIESLVKETHELIAIIVSTIRSAKRAGPR